MILRFMYNSQIDICMYIYTTLGKFGILATSCRHQGPKNGAKSQKTTEKIPKLAQNQRENYVKICSEILIAVVFRIKKKTMKMASEGRNSFRLSCQKGDSLDISAGRDPPSQVSSPLQGTLQIHIVYVHFQFCYKYIQQQMKEYASDQSRILCSKSCTVAKIPYSD